MVDIDLRLGDCLEILPTLETGSVDAVITDPPYGLGTRTTEGGTNKNSLTRFKEDMRLKRWDDETPPKKLFDLLRSVGKHQIIWGGNYFELPPSRGYLVWDKMTYLPSMSRVELAWTNADIPAKYIMINSNNSNRVHPTQKPVSLMKWCIELFTNPTDTILDPFMGSGTTGVACVQTGRNFIGIEIEEKYFNIAEKRIAEAQLQIRMEI